MANIITIANAIIALASTFKLVGDLIDKVSELWIDKAIEDVRGKKVSKQSKRQALMKSIKQAQSNEQRKILSVILADIDGN